MDYSTLIQKIGNVDVPTEENISRLVEAEDSIHFVILSRRELYITGFYDALVALEVRGAVRGKDFVICSREINGRPSLEIHSTKSFLSLEDFPPGITVEDTRNNGKR